MVQVIFVFALQLLRHRFEYLIYTFYVDPLSQGTLTQIERLCIAEIVGEG